MIAIHKQTDGLIDILIDRIRRVGKRERKSKGRWEEREREREE